MLLIDVLRHIHARGHAPEFPSFGAAFLAWATRDMGRALISRYQQYRGLPVTGVVTPEVEAMVTAPRCGHPDILAVTGGESAWGITKLAYWQEIAYPGIDPDELASDYALAVERVTAVCGLSVIPAAAVSSAQIVAGSAPIDGPWNVLALSELPPPRNVSLTLKQKYDVAEVALTRTQRQAMMAHEFCHALGLGHAPPGSGALMEPVLSDIAMPQAWDIRELLARYPMTGDPGPDPGPGPSPGPSPVPPPLAGVPVTGTGSIVTTRQAGAQYTVGLDAAGKYLILVVPMP